MNTNKTIIQPDVYVICDPNRIQGRDVLGGPDLAVEILSVSTMLKDSVIKLEKYKNAGVKFYWLVDPFFKLVLVYDLERLRAGDTGNCVKKHTFHDKIPVGIWPEGAVVDFEKIMKFAQPLYDAQKPDAK